MKSKKIIIIGFIVAIITFFGFSILLGINGPGRFNIGNENPNLEESNLIIIAHAQEPQANYPIHSGFPIQYDRWTERSSATIADINNDGKMEVLLPTHDGTIYAWNSSGKLLAGFPIYNPGYQMRGHLTLGDLNHDGNLEIAASLDLAYKGGVPRVGIWNPNGTPYAGWPKTTACTSSSINCNITSIVMSDVDNDSHLEIIASTNNRDLTSADPSRVVPNLYVWESSGTLMDGWPNEDDHNTGITGQIAVGDLNGDTYPDIVTGRDYNRLFAFNRSGTSLNSYWPHYVFYPGDEIVWTKDQIEFPRSAPVLADLNLDGKLEYIIPGHRREANSAKYTHPELLVYDANATRFSGWEDPAQGSSMSWVSNTTRMIEAPAIADLTGDGKPEIIQATQDGYIRAFTAEKNMLWEYNYNQGRQIHATEVVVGDIDGDGRNEIIFGTYWLDLVSKGQVGVIVLDDNGGLNSSLMLNSVGISSTPALGDLDGDDLIEIVAATYDGLLYAWDTPGSALPERLPWPLARHDLQRTGLFQAPPPSFTQSSKTASPSNAKIGDLVTYTIRLIRTGAKLEEAVILTDIIPSGLEYVPGSFKATAGIADDIKAPTLTWTGAGKLFDQNQVTITYQAKAVTSKPMGIKNTAKLQVSTVLEIQLSSTIIVNGKNCYLPMIVR